MTRENICRAAFAVLMGILVLSTQSWAQDAASSYKVGEKVEYRDRSDSTVWFQGTIVKLYPEYKQVVVRWDPRADYPSYTHDGASIYEQGYIMDSVRHIKNRIADKPEDKNGGADAPASSSYKVGQRVEYRDRNDYVVWYEGTIVSLHSSPEQVVIRLDPRPGYEGFTHNGVNSFEQAYNMENVRHIKARITDKPEDKNGGADEPVNPANNAMKDKTGGAKTGDGKGLMTKEEILGYMKTNGYVNGQPKYDQQVCRDLIEQMKRRGVKEIFTGGIEGDDTDPIYKNGCGSPSDDVVGAAARNLGTPTTLDWLFGKWSLHVFGGTLKTAPGDGYLYTTNEIAAGEKGFLTINGNGTYTWKVAGDPPTNINGTWRNATKKEMGLQGGAGIVLLKGEAGSDWIAFKQMDPNKTHKEERIEVDGLLEGGSYKRYGPRR